MNLKKQEIDGLMRLIGLTKDEEINCEQCLELVAEFAELALAEKTIPEVLKTVEHHLSVCTDCREEYEILQKTLKEMNK